MQDGHNMRTSWLHEYGSIFGCVRWAAAMAVMPAFIALVIRDAFVLGNPVSLSVILGFMAAGMVVVAIDTLARKGKIDQSKVDAGWDRSERLFSPAGYASTRRHSRRDRIGASRLSSGIGASRLSSGAEHQHAPPTSTPITSAHHQRPSPAPIICAQRASINCM
jgi:hypothetical protein